MINDLINNKQIEIHLQPIVSVKDKKIFAYEALTRATDRYGESVSPIYLFEQAKKERLSSELDEYVRELALLKFQTYYNEDKSVLLFLNFEPSVIEGELSKNFISTVYKYNIATQNIVIEIKEDRIKNTHALKSFIDMYRKHGFFIAIDDFGTGYSSFDRLEFIQPEIVKVDRSLVYNIHNNFINSEILNAISNMCHQIGVLVLAEGVEDRDEVLACIKKDIDVFQGFWFSKPQEDIDNSHINDIKKSIKSVALKHQSNVKEVMNSKKLLLESSQDLTQQVISILQVNGIENMQKVDTVIAQTPKLQAIYILNELDGKQIGKTVIDAEDKTLFKPTNSGHDHSLREYYFIAKDSTRGDYLSKKYISKASGNMCRTYSAKVQIESSHYIVCFDIIDH